jgi:hypothetical protein
MSGNQNTANFGYYWELIRECIVGTAGQAICRLSQICKLIMYAENKKNRGSAVGIATGYRLDDRRVRVRVPLASRIFTSPYRPDQIRGPPNLLSDGYWVLFPGEIS